MIFQRGRPISEPGTGILGTLRSPLSQWFVLVEWEVYFPQRISCQFFHAQLRCPWPFPCHRQGFYGSGVELQQEPSSVPGHCVLDVVHSRDTSGGNLLSLLEAPTNTVISHRGLCGLKGPLELWVPLESRPQLAGWLPVQPAGLGLAQGCWFAG